MPVSCKIPPNLPCAPAASPQDWQIPDPIRTMTKGTKNDPAHDPLKINIVVGDVQRSPVKCRGLQHCANCRAAGRWPRETLMAPLMGSLAAGAWSERLIFLVSPQPKIYHSPQRDHCRTRCLFLQPRAFHEPYLYSFPIYA